MRAQVTLQLGRRGTKKLHDRYGDQLVRVRDRYDAVRQRRLKTVALIVEEIPCTRSVLRAKGRTSLASVLMSKKSRDSAR